jgi:predicted DsbA family dithiol-disulfide isomerase
MHPQACGLALAAICAEEQGKLEPMDDALFRNQQAKRPVEEIATAVGLDLSRFRRCLASPEAAARLRSDVEAGIRVGVQATPTYVIGGRAYSGGIPVEVLPPPRAASAGRAPRQ